MKWDSTNSKINTFRTLLGFLIKSASIVSSTLLSQPGDEFKNITMSI